MSVGGDNNLPIPASSQSAARKFSPAGVDPTRGNGARVCALSANTVLVSNTAPAQTRSVQSLGEKFNPLSSPERRRILAYPSLSKHQR